MFCPERLVFFQQSLRFSDENDTGNQGLFGDAPLITFSVYNLAYF